MNAVAATKEAPDTGKRKPAPKAQVTRIWTDEREGLINDYAPECVGRESEFTAYWADPTEPPQRRKRMGYEPVIDPDTNEQVTHNGDPLWKTPRENSTARIDRPAQLSKETLTARWTGQDADSRELQATPTDETTVYKDS